MKYALACFAGILTIASAINTVAAQDGQQADQLQSQEVESRWFESTNRESPYARFKLSIVPSSESADVVKVFVETTIADGWHISPTEIRESEFGLATTIKIKSEGLVAIDDAFVSSSEPSNGMVGGETQQYHTGQFSWTREYRIEKPFSELDATASIRFQICDDKKCLPPKTIRFALKPSSDSSEPEEAFETVEIHHKKIGEPIEVSLKKCDMERRKVKLGDISVVSVMFSGIGKDKLDLKGQIAVGDETFDFYLPKAEKFTLKNTGDGPTSFENTADYMAIDHNENGKLEAWESIGMNSTIRIADSMFRVTRADRKSKKITFQQVNAPVVGAIVGRKCPPFSYSSTEGKTITDKSILGKVTILDIWAVT